MTVFDTRPFEKHRGLSVVADRIFEIGCILDKSESPGGQGFRMKLHEKKPDAPLSPIYINLRTLRSFPMTLNRVAILFESMARDLDLQYDLVADVPTAATPIVAVLSLRTSYPMITPREAKEHGVGGTIDGVFNPGQTVLLIDDLITMADSKLAAIRTLEHHGLKVRDVMVLVDREQGGAGQLQQAGYRVHAAFKISDLLRYYCVIGKMSEEVYQEVMVYLGLPA